MTTFPGISKSGRTPSNGHSEIGFSLRRAGASTSRQPMIAALPTWLLSSVQKRQHACLCPLPPRSQRRSRGPVARRRGHEPSLPFSESAVLLTRSGALSPACQTGRVRRAQAGFGLPGTVGPPPPRLSICHRNSVAGIHVDVRGGGRYWDIGPLLGGRLGRGLAWNAGASAPPPRSLAHGGL